MADASTNSWTSTSIIGVLGVAMHDIVTNSSGYPTGTPAALGSGSPVNSPTYQLGNYAQGLPGDAQSGRGKILVALSGSNNHFRAQIASSNVALTITKSLFQGGNFGLALGNDVASFWKVDTSYTGANQKLVLVTEIDDSQSTYNASSKITEVVFRFLATYSQSDLGLLWTT